MAGDTGDVVLFWDRAGLHSFAYGYANVCWFSEAVVCALACALAPPHSIEIFREARMWMRMARISVLRAWGWILALACSSVPALGWGSRGHELVAYLAY